MKVCKHILNIHFKENVNKANIILARYIVKDITLNVSWFIEVSLKFSNNPNKPWLPSLYLQVLIKSNYTSV